VSGIGVAQAGQVRVSAGTGGHRLAQCCGMVLVGAQSVGRAVDADDGGAVQKPVEHGGGDGCVTESCCPVSDPDVRAQNRRWLQVSLVDDLEQCGRAVTGQRQVAQFINDR
jgi:hypothetical protein